MGGEGTAKECGKPREYVLEVPGKKMFQGTVKCQLFPRGQATWRTNKRLLGFFCHGDYRWRWTQFLRTRVGSHHSVVGGKEMETVMRTVLQKKSVLIYGTPFCAQACIGCCGLFRSTICSLLKSKYLFCFFKLHINLCIICRKQVTAWGEGN